MLTFFRTNSSHKDFIHLVKLLDTNHSFEAQFNKVYLIQDVIVAYQNEEAT